jgi:hypothetical protein
VLAFSGLSSSVICWTGCVQPALRGTDVAHHVALGELLAQVRHGLLHVSGGRLGSHALFQQDNLGDDVVILPGEVAQSLVIADVPGTGRPDAPRRRWSGRRGRRPQPGPSGQLRPATRKALPAPAGCGGGRTFAFGGRQTLPASARAGRGAGVGRVMVPGWLPRLPAQPPAVGWRRAPRSGVGPAGAGGLGSGVLLHSLRLRAFRRASAVRISAVLPRRIPSSEAVLPRPATASPALHGLAASSDCAPSVSGAAGHFGCCFVGFLTVCHR